MLNGTMLDERYRFERKLGTALLATHIGTGSRMVIKPRSCFQDPQAVKLLSQMRHPSLPRIIDEISIQEVDCTERCLVTEYLEGETFSEWMKSSDGRLLPDQLLPLMAEVARTISFLHEQNEPHMLHLDVKPEHLIRMPDGHAGLIDFDCCRLYPLDPITKSTIRCTVGYAAPELMSGSPGPESDIYALGVTMLVLLTGKNITDGVLPPIGSLHQLIPPAVMTILANCINSDPKMRYSSAAALACALENQMLRKNRIANRSKINISDAQKIDPVPNMVSADPIKIDRYPIINQTSQQKEDVLPQISNEPLVHRYPDQLVVIWDQASFAVSMADHLTRCDIQTIMIDADLLNPRVDMLLGFDASRRPNDSDEMNGQPANGVANGLELALTALMRKTVAADRFPELLQKTNRPHLRALTGCYRLRDYDYYDPQILLDLFRMSRMHADVVLVCCNRFIHDSFTCLSLLAADLVLIPLVAEPGAIREFNRYLDFLVSQYPFDRRKVRFIATDYDSNQHLSWGMIDELCDGLLAGCIPREKMTPEFSRRKNIFRQKRTHKSVNEYNQLLRRLGFIKSRDDGR